ncbi:uncharacterized protein LOC128263272 [Drosophila gunungcola]|uniref:uncharacterized protein LOC128263272 n=1 Tax=Drosophila gunungcola TaxID=103775 RepID=UPI0022E4639D|nr:uncharacterized protein LOC128263272 [Drosophila gunungcola]
MKLWFWICCFLILKCMRTEERNFRLFIDQVNITHVDPEVYESFDCKVFQFNNRSYLDSSHTFKYTVSDLKVHAVLDFWKLKSRQKMTLFDVRLDACYLLDNASKNKLFNIYIKNLRKHANTKFKCPFQANISYEVQNMTMNEQDFPSFVPLGKFRSVIEYIIDQKLAARVIASGKIVSYLNDP